MEYGDIDTFKLKVRGMKRGERYRYHNGFLFEDRMYDKALDTYAKAVWSLYRAGMVTLVQKHTGPSSDYFLVRL